MDLFFAIFDAVKMCCQFYLGLSLSYHIASVLEGGHVNTKYLNLKTSFSTFQLITKERAHQGQCLCFNEIQK